MKIAVTSQDFRTITAHAGKTTHFLVFETSADAAPRELERLDLAASMMIHEHRGEGAHPLRAVDVLVTGGAGAGFVRRLAAWGVRVAVTDQTDPVAAVTACARGELAVRDPGDDAGHCGGHPHGHEHGRGHGGCGHCGS